MRSPAEWADEVERRATARAGVSPLLLSAARIHPLFAQVRQAVEEVIREAMDERTRPLRARINELGAKLGHERISPMEDLR
jgi:molybdopterin-guanine dinucleotide biosynthesis protein A